MRKINAFKNNTLKVEHVRKTFKNLNSILKDVENAKNDAKYIKNIFFCIFVVFRYFWIFRKFYKKGVG
jgi:hypothetical protein